MIHRLRGVPCTLIAAIALVTLTMPTHAAPTDRQIAIEDGEGLETGGWTHVKVDVSGVRARLFVNGAAQPTLIVNDLKRGAI